jgi:hypothetical protein
MRFAVVDLGAGDGRRVYPILETLIAVGKHIEYWAVDASGPMLTRNRPIVEPVVDIYIEANSPLGRHFPVTIPFVSTSTAHRGRA